MARLHSLAIGLLAVGLIDVVYLDMRIAPALLAERERSVDVAQAEPAPPFAAKLLAAPEQEAESPVPQLARPEPSIPGPTEPDAEPAIHIFFDQGEIDHGPEARAQLDRIARSLSEDPTLRVIVEGHADGHGPPERNQELSRRRADRVARYLESRGVARARVTVRGLGERRLLDHRDGARADRRNRRVDVRVAGAGAGVDP
jgi:outer membrane protein OmpA-like peptidoglycan-associated protein